VSLRDALCLAAAAEEQPGAPALVSERETVTFAELATRAERLRARLVREGALEGARVALTGQPSVELAVAIHALVGAGAVIVPLHPRSTAAERAGILERVRPQRVLDEDELASLWREAAHGPAAARRDPREAGPGGALAIVFTSGTSGAPKGAVLSRAAFAASARASAENLGSFAGDRWLACMPLCHVGGLSILTRCLRQRSAVILVPRFDPDEVLARIERDRATLLSVVPTMLHALIERDGANVLASLRAVLVGGAAPARRLLEDCAARGIVALTTYGLTEACSQVTAQGPRDGRVADGSSGHVLRGTELRIVADGADAGPGREGSIRVRGATLMDGYFNGPERAPDPARDADGWFDTGDVGALGDDGRLFVRARRTDLIVTGGENVAPVEVEQALEALPDVRRALVFGVPDDRWGAVVAAALELAPGVEGDVARGGISRVLAAMAPLASTLAPHKLPRRACAVSRLPLTPSGKLDRAGALALFARELEPVAWSRARA
jgi:o-succinylbenzoate---CoA ligase